NRNKKEEILKLLTLSEKCNNILSQNSICLLRVHNLTIVTKINAIDWNNFPKEKYKRYQPKNRVCHTHKYSSLGTINLYPDSNTVDIHLLPFYIVYDVCKRVCPPTNLPLEELYDTVLFHKFWQARETLAADNIYISDIYTILDCSKAIMNDPLASIAVKLGFKYKSRLHDLDQSVKPVPEYEVHGIDSIKKIKIVLGLRKYCMENNITEVDLDEHLAKYPINKPLLST
ncbi:MAG: hypothetical protein ABIJ08_05485, partial [Nanoarchaeota archaeon]